MMSSELINALTIIGVALTLWGVILPVWMYYRTNKMMAKMEMDKQKLISEMEIQRQKLEADVEAQKLRIAARTTYETKLDEKRLNVYQDLFYLLSNFVKKIDFESESLSKGDVVNLLNDMNKWDSPNAIFLSELSAQACFNFRHDLYELKKKSEDEIRELFSDEQYRDDLRDKTVAVELTLRIDLGVYGIEPSADNVYQVRSPILLQESMTSLQQLAAKFREYFKKDTSNNSSDVEQPRA